MGRGSARSRPRIRACPPVIANLCACASSTHHTQPPAGAAGGEGRGMDFTAHARVRFATPEHAAIACRSLAVDDELQPTKAAKDFTTEGPFLVGCVAASGLAAGRVAARAGGPPDTCHARSQALRSLAGAASSYFAMRLAQHVCPLCSRLATARARALQPLPRQRGARAARGHVVLLRHAGCHAAHPARLRVDSSEGMQACDEHAGPTRKALRGTSWLGSSHPFLVHVLAACGATPKPNSTKPAPKS